MHFPPTVHLAIKFMNNSASSNTNPQNGLLPNILGWIAHPFNSQGSALNWVLFLGLLVVAWWAWNYVLLQITERV